jgi:hypothetical protein
MSRLPSRRSLAMVNLMKVSLDKIALGITDDEVLLGSHLIHFWHTDGEFERGVRFLELSDLE